MVPKNAGLVSCCLSANLVPKASTKPQCPWRCVVRYMSQPGGCPRGVYRCLSLPSDGDTRIAPGFCHGDNRTRIVLARIAAPAWLHQDDDTTTALLE